MLRNQNNIRPKLIIHASMLDHALNGGQYAMLRVIIGSGGDYTLIRCQRDECQFEIFARKTSDDQAAFGMQPVPDDGGQKENRGQVIIYAERINGAYDIVVSDDVAASYRLKICAGNVTEHMNIRAGVIDELDYIIGTKLNILAHRIGVFNSSMLNPNEKIEDEQLKSMIRENYEKRSHEFFD